MYCNLLLSVGFFYLIHFVLLQNHNITDVLGIRLYKMHNVFQGFVANDIKSKHIEENQHCPECHASYNGTLMRVTDPHDLSKQCFVSISLECEYLKLFKESTVLQEYHVKTISTPLLMVPGSRSCFFLKNSVDTHIEILCTSNTHSRNEWWKAITRAVLCSHHGTAFRKEMAGDPIIEEEERLVEEKVVADPHDGGLNIMLTDISETPKIIFPHKQSTS